MALLNYKQLGEPSVEPVSLAQAKQHLRVDFDYDDNYIPALITAARQYIEKVANIAIYQRPMLLALDYPPFPGWESTFYCAGNAYDALAQYYFRGLAIRLPIPDTVSVEKIQQLNYDGYTWNVLSPDTYYLDTTGRPARVIPTPGNTWVYPQQYVPGQFQIYYTAGTWELSTTETFTVPSVAPYTYTLLKPLINFETLVNSSGEKGSYTLNTAPSTVGSPVTGAQLTLDSSLAGVELTATYTFDACPKAIYQAMLLLIKHWYDHRAASTDQPMKTLPLAVNALITPYKRMTTW
jgi:Phage gp6-like head-tail connector protein